MKYYTNFFIHRGQVYLRGRENGKRFSKKIKIKPYLFVPSNKASSQYKSIHGKQLERMDFDSIYDAREFTKKYKDVSGFEIYGLDKHEYVFINDEFPGEMNFDASKVKTASIDIEVNADDGFPDPAIADKQVTAITLIRNDLIISFGLKPFDAPAGVIYLQFASEEALLRKFLEVWNELDLDVITGWNIKLFDIPYLVNRIRRLLGSEYADTLSPWGIIYDRELTIMNRTHPVFELKGIAVLDGLELYKKFTYVPRESYSLNHIAYVELGETKVDYSEYESLLELYEKDPQKYMEYNIRDTALPLRIDAKLKLVELAITMAYSAKINFEDVYSPIGTWDVIIHNALMEDNIAVSPLKHSAKESFTGAYVKPPQVGMHADVASFDVEGLYPAIIVQNNISPETYRGRVNRTFEIKDLLTGALHSSNIPKEIKDSNLCLSVNSTLWDKDFQGLFPKLVIRFREERKKFKSMMLKAKSEYENNPSEELKNSISKYDNLQMARKLLLNSLYGALGNVWFRWYDLAFAEAITLTGQLAIRWVEKDLNAFLFAEFGAPEDRVIAIDTDSVYLNLSCLPNKPNMTRIEMLDEYCSTTLNTVIENSFASLAEYLNSYTQFLVMKREALADRGIWTAKKRYILNVHNNEGVQYAEPKLKMMGIEAIRSSTPEICRNKLKEVIALIMTGSESDVINFIEDFRKDFYKLGIDDIAFPRSVNGLVTYHNSSTIYGKKTPIAVRGALMYNHLIKKANLDKKYELIKEGEKIKYCYLKLPNPSREDVISYVNSLPKQLGLDAYIDHKTQFEKAFLGPLTSILDAIGYQSEKTSTLDNFF